MADLASYNPTGRTVGLATTAPVCPGGGGQPELAEPLAERAALWRYSPRMRARKYAKAARLTQVNTAIRSIAEENALCATCLNDLAGAQGAECPSCEEVPF